MPKQNHNNTVDIAIIGGGIAGLWTLARLRQAGYQAILLEADALGCRQSGASQGIIHGGTKYALTGKLTHSAQSIQQMPQRWQACLEGVGDVDLSQATILSKHQYLWSNNSLSTKLTGFFASKVMHSRMQAVSAQDYRPPFQHSRFKGNLYQLEEPVLEMYSVFETLRQQFSQYIFQYPVIDIHKQDKSGHYHIQSSKHRLLAQTLILSSGAGNESLLKYLGFTQPKMQRRPLLMPMLKAKSEILPKLYAHCLGVSAVPKMTITAHAYSKTQTVWYLGGEIAEKGVGRSISAQTQAAQSELKTLMPWMDFSHCQWSALAIDRAEPKMPDPSGVQFAINSIVTDDVISTSKISTAY